MKARVKSTGEIVDVFCDFKGMRHDFLDEKGKGYVSDELTIFDNEDYEQGWNDGYYEAVNTNTEPDYWERLKHQYAGMAMQGLLMNEHVYCGQDMSDALDDFVSTNAVFIATALVEKLNEERK